MTAWSIRTSAGKEKLGSFFGTRKEAVRWVKRHYKIPFQLVSSKTGIIYIYNKGKDRQLNYVYNPKTDNWIKK